MKTPKYILAALGSFLAVFSLGTAKAAVIVAWDAKPGNTTLSSATASTLDPNLVGSVTLNLGPGFNANSYGGSTFGGYATTDTSSGLASANSAGTYWSFTLNPAAGNQVQVDSVIVNRNIENQSNLHGLFTWQGTPATTVNLASSLDSYGSSLGSASVIVSGLDAGYFTLNLNTPFITTSPVTFRIAISENFGWKSIGLSPDSFWDPAQEQSALVINGAVTAIPEPSTYALVMGGIATLLLIRRRVQA
jgi:hypothetical protein